MSFQSCCKLFCLKVLTSFKMIYTLNCKKIIETFVQALQGAGKPVWLVQTNHVELFAMFSYDNLFELAESHIESWEFLVKNAWAQVY